MHVFTHQPFKNQLVTSTPRKSLEGDKEEVLGRFIETIEAMDINDSTLRDSDSKGFDSPSKALLRTEESHSPVLSYLKRRYAISPKYIIPAKKSKSSI